MSQGGRFTDYDEQKVALSSGGKSISLGNPAVVGSQYNLTVDNSNSGNDLPTLVGGTIPTGATAFLMSVETNDIRISFDGSDPTSNGFLYPKGAGTVTIDMADLTQVRMVAQTASATVRLQFIK